LRAREYEEECRKQNKIPIEDNDLREALKALPGMFLSNNYEDNWYK
jgi:hypothetical protein